MAVSVDVAVEVGGKGVKVGVDVNAATPKFTIAVPPTVNTTGSTLLGVVPTYPLGGNASTLYQSLCNPSKL